MNPVSAQEAYYLGEIELADDELSEFKLASVATVFTSDDQFTAFLHSLQVRQNMRHEHLSRLVKVDNNVKSTWCSSMYTVVATYEYLPESLQKEVSSRRARGVPFSGQELLRLAYDLVDVLAFLQAHNTVNYYVAPALIFLYDDVALGLKRAKLIERLSFNRSKKTNLLSAMARGFEVYCDPAFFEWYSKTDKPLEAKNHYK